MKSQEIPITKAEYDEIIDTFMPSEDMRKFLKETSQLQESILQQLIIGAPVSLATKQETIQKLASRELPGSSLASSTYRIPYQIILDELEKAFEAYNSLGMFTLEDCWYDIDIGEEKNRLCGAFDRAVLAKKYIRKSYEEDKCYCGADFEEDSVSAWWTLRKWEKQKNDMPKLIYIFYLVGTEVYWFERADGLHFGKELGIRLGSSRPFLDSTNLWLPVPYKEGDAVEINTFPFGPKQPAFITDIDGDWIDVVIKNHKGEWIEGGIVHCFLGRSIYQNDYVSPLYWIRRWPRDKKINGGEAYV